MKVHVRFVGELNDLVTPPAKRVAPAEVAPGTTVKDLIESLGVPHTEVDVITVNGRSVDFGHRCQNGDRLTLFPHGTAPGSGAVHLQPAPPSEARFILDVHLGRLARYLRLVGFDAVWGNDLSDPELAEVSRREDRILLTRDRGLLKRREVTRAYYVRETERLAQVVEVLRRFDLFDRIEPFGRCLECNGPLVDVAKQAVEHQLPPRTQRDFHEFRRCSQCHRVYWKGSHYDRLQAVVANIRRARHGRATSTALSPMASAARAALERGWSVVPMHTPTAGRCSCGNAACAAPGKHPRVAWVRFMREAAPLAEVERWWSRWPRANLGVVTGPVSGLVVLDIDPRHGGGEGLAELESTHGSLPHTVEALTGGGGQHLYFCHPGGSFPSRPLVPGVDLKADGGLVVSPPSTHATGRPYVWERASAPWECEPAEMPGWLVDLALDPPGPARPGAEVPVRTDSERAEFAELWRQVDITLGHGDRTYLCPFHADHHPSLHIDAEGCRFYCFGCARGGGIGRLRRLVGPSDQEWTSRSADLSHPDEERTTLSGGVEVRVVGTSEHQDTLLELTGGRRHYAGTHVRTVAQLVPGVGPSGSPDVVGVRIDGFPVGHLPGFAAARATEAIDAAIRLDGQATCHALIVGGWEREHGDVGYFGVRLLLPGDA